MARVTDRFDKNGNYTGKSVSHSKSEIQSAGRDGALIVFGFVVLAIAYRFAKYIHDSYTAPSPPISYVVNYYNVVVIHPFEWMIRLCGEISTGYPHIDVLLRIVLGATPFALVYCAWAATRARFSKIANSIAIFAIIALIAPGLLSFLYLVLEPIREWFLAS